MAPLSDFRSSIVAAPTTNPIIDAEIECTGYEEADLFPGICIHCTRSLEYHLDEDDWEYEDEDFWNAISLMDTSYNIFKGMLRVLRVSPGRRKIIDEHMADLKQFVDEFSPADDVEEKK